VTAPSYDKPIDINKHGGFTGIRGIHIVFVNKADAKSLVWEEKLLDKVYDPQSPARAISETKGSKDYDK